MSLVTEGGTTDANITIDMAIDEVNGEALTLNAGTGGDVDINAAIARGRCDRAVDGSGRQRGFRCGR